MISFVKVSLYGNSFILIDTTEGDLQLTTKTIKNISRIATDVYDGLSSDNLVIIQNNCTLTWNEISNKHGYKFEHQRLQDCEYVFRMYEPDGKEASSCGNALLCIAKYLDEKGITLPCKVFTEIPSKRPNTVLLAKHDNELYTVNLGVPVYDYQNFINISEYYISYHDIQPKLKLRVNLKQSTIDLVLNYVYTGEPHLVAFIDENKFLEGLLQGDNMHICSGLVCDFQLIGRELNRKKRLFPFGINFSIALINNHKRIIYRSFERGIFKETLACGTGVAAITISATNNGYIKGTTSVSSFTGMILRKKKSSHTVSLNTQTNECTLMARPEIIHSGHIRLSSIKYEAEVS